MLITFTVKGNGIDRKANPKPKIKKTHRQYWTPAAQKYKVWKAHVATALIEAVEAREDEDWLRFVDISQVEKPIILPDKERAFMLVEIDLKNNGSRPDGENVYGSVADALFQEDKYLSGAYIMPVEPVGAGAAHVTIAIGDKEVKKFLQKLKI